MVSTIGYFIPLRHNILGETISLCPRGLNKVSRGQVFLRYLSGGTKLEGDRKSSYTGTGSIVGYAVTIGMCSVGTFEGFSL